LARDFLRDLGEAWHGVEVPRAGQPGVASARGATPFSTFVLTMPTNNGSVD
jgi:hypothetical protein